MDSFTKFTYWVAAFFFMGLVLAGFCMLFALPTYLLWNWLMPVFGLPTLSIWQSFGLMMLCNILFGGFRMPEQNFKDIFNNKRK
tara:strand:- start:702 stop:953 length:252 start_codon:yes stop_codon:yes gene_type:complete